MTEIIQTGDPVLREKAREVETDEIGSDEIGEIIERMKDALHNSKNGVALAAPQIGESVRIFIVSGHVFAGEEEDTNTHPDMVFINPVIVRMSKDIEELEEGCLSVDGKYGKMDRAVRTRVQALDEHGKKFEYGGSGLLAQIFQHETDHLNGILFTDTARDVKDVDEQFDESR